MILEKLDILPAIFQRAITNQICSAFIIFQFVSLNETIPTAFRQTFLKKKFLTQLNQNMP